GRSSGEARPTARALAGPASPSVPATATAAPRGGHATHRRWPRGRGGGAKPARRRHLPEFAARPSSDWSCRARPSYRQPLDATLEVRAQICRPDVVFVIPNWLLNSTNHISLSTRE